MTDAVWKLTLKPGMNEYQLPRGAVPLYVREQNEQVCLWFLTDPSVKTTEKRKFLVVGTGHEIAGDVGVRNYVGSAHLMGGALVFHVFDVTYVK